jgi:hypothetical protein
MGSPVVQGLLANKIDLTFEMTRRKDVVVRGREGNAMAGIRHHVRVCQCVKVELVGPGPSPKIPSLTAPVIGGCIANSSWCRENLR